MALAGLRFLYSLACGLSWTLWFGGLTFYAAIVVPTGSQQIGETEQGMITQEVTLWLNLIGAVSLAIWLPSLWLRRTSPRWVWRRALLLWLLHVVLLGLLAVLHQHLSSLLDFEARGPTTSSFYEPHRLYLIVTTLQWCGLLAVGVDWLWTRWPAAEARQVPGSGLPDA